MREANKQRPGGWSLESLSDAYRKMAPYLNIGYVMTASVVLFTFLGYYLDKHWETRPWLTVAGATVGVVVGFYQFFKIVLGLEKRKENGKT